MEVPAGNAAIAIAWTGSMALFDYGRPSPLESPSSLTISSSVSYSVSIHTVAPEVPDGGGDARGVGHIGLLQIWFEGSATARRPR